MFSPISLPFGFNGGEWIGCVSRFGRWLLLDSSVAHVTSSGSVDHAPVPSASSLLLLPIMLDDVGRISIAGEAGDGGSRGWISTMTPHENTNGRA